MPAVSRYLSRLYYGTKPSVLADGVAEIAVKALILDVNGAPVHGHVVTLAADVEGVVIEQPPPTNSRGYAVGTVRSITPGEVNITAFVGTDASESSEDAG